MQQTTEEGGKRPATMLYTRKMVAAIIQVDSPQLKKWAKDSNPELFTLPGDGHRPHHRQHVLFELNRMHNRCRWLAPLVEVPKILHTSKDVQAHFGISRRTLQTWASMGAPRFLFTERTVRYLISELEQWYALRCNRPQMK